jgi:hypothetical protein
MIGDDITIHAMLLPHKAHATGLLIRKVNHVTKKAYVARVEWVELKEDGESLIDPFCIYVDEYQGTTLSALMDDLWRDGVRPSGEYHGTAGQLAIAQEHLKDLRKIAFHALKIP